MVEIEGGHPQRAADDYLTSYRVGVAKTNTVIWSVALSLIVAWLSVIEQSYSDIKQAATNDPRATKLEQRISFLEKKKAEIYSSISKNNPGTIISNQNIIQYLDDEQANEIDEIESKIEEKRDKITSLLRPVEFGAFGAKFSIPRKALTIVWMALLVWLVTFIVIRRSTLSVTLGKSVINFRKMVKSPGESSEPHANRSTGIADIAGEAPFWMAPVLKNEIADATVLRNALGWDNNTYRTSVAFAALTNVILIIIALRVVYISFMLNDESDVIGKITATDDVERWLSNFLLVGGLLLSAIQAFRWLSPALKSSYLSALSQERRTFLFGSAGLATWVGSTWILSRSISWDVDESGRTVVAAAIKDPRRLTVNPRFKIKNQHYDPPKGTSTIGFYKVSLSSIHNEGPKSEVIYFDNHDSPALRPRIYKKLGSISGLTLELIQTVNEEVVGALSRSDAPYAFERHAVALMLGNPSGVESAIELLETAVAYDLSDGKTFRRDGRPATRLLDLLATLYARNNKSDKLNRLAKRLRLFAVHRPTGNRTADKQALIYRADKWENTKSDWHLRRADPSKRVVWHCNVRLGKPIEIEIKKV